jgi:hypothetical protein
MTLTSSAADAALAALIAARRRMLAVLTARDPRSILHAGHLVAQRLGQERWYRACTVRIARVERDYTWSAEPIRAMPGTQTVTRHEEPT